MSEPAPSQQTPYRKFESFLKRLVAVPKAEIDAKQAEQKAHGRPAYSSNDRQRMHDQAQP
ncbi:MAG TPA: hypothetical protein VK009_00690 [Chloroflexota bacterium]|nr:hypothetical protein [Chloroflexota bacterium]